MKAFHRKYILNFKSPSGTSRGVLKTKETFFLILKEDGRYGIGECGLLRGLSMDDVPHYEEKLDWVCKNIALGKHKLHNALANFPSIQFGLEQAFISLRSKDGPFNLFPSSFTRGEEGIAINGLIWMGNTSFMQEQIDQKLAKGFQCIKLKIGAIDFEKEIQLLSDIRKKYKTDQVELRVDANGAFSIEEAQDKLEELAIHGIHSIEQPIAKGNWKAMKKLSRSSPIPIALDEELIGVKGLQNKKRLLETIEPHYIILKPSLLGGFDGCREWITLAKNLKIGWWITSALESNIGLNAIAQWVYSLQVNLPQGLGTGGLFKNNLESPLVVEQGQLHYNINRDWNKNLIKELCI
jgi:o-succinylbenzoate synthase